MTEVSPEFKRLIAQLGNLSKADRKAVEASLSFEERLLLKEAVDQSKKTVATARSEIPPKQQELQKLKQFSPWLQKHLRSVLEERQAGEGQITQRALDCVKSTLSNQS